MHFWVDLQLGQSTSTVLGECMGLLHTVSNHLHCRVIAGNMFLRPQEILSLRGAADLDKLEQVGSSNPQPSIVSCPC